MNCIRLFMAPRRALRVAKTYRARAHHAERVGREISGALTAVADAHAKVMRERDDALLRLQSAQRQAADAERGRWEVLHQRDKFRERAVCAEQELQALRQKVWT